MNEALWRWLLQAEWQGSLLILAILFLGLAFGRRLSARWRFALWMVVVARLLLPSVDFIPARVNRFIPPTPKQAWKQIVPEAPIPAILSPRFEPPLSSADLGENRTAAPLPATGPSRLRLKLPPPGEIALWIWGMVALGGIVRLAVCHWYFLEKLKFQASQPGAGLAGMMHDCKDELGIRREVSLVITNVVDTPAMLGLFSPRLLLPEHVVETQSREALRLIFLHELAHMKRHDAWTNLLGTLASIIHWFNPLVWWALRRMRAEREMAVDALVLSVHAGEAREAYGETLLSLLVPDRGPQVQSLLGIVEDTAELKRRITAIARFRPGAYAWSILGVALVLMAVLVGFAQRLEAELKPLPHSLIASRDGIRVFFNATRHGDVDTLRQFADGGFDLNTTLTVHGETGLICAANYQQADAVRFLISKRAQVNIKTSWGETAVSQALLYGNRKIADMLIAAGAEYDKALYLVSTGDLGGLKELDAKAPLEKRPLLKALRYAATAGHSEVFDWLLAKATFANDEERSKKMKEIYGDVINSGPASMLAHLEALGVDPLKFGGKALSDAVHNDEFLSRTDVVRHLLEKGVGANETSLPEAVRFASLEIVRLLVDHGADVNAASKGNSPLQEAVIGRRRDVAEFLLDHGANPNATITNSKGAEGQNAAWLAVQISGCNAEDGSPSHRWQNAAWAAACNTDTPELLELLMRHGADVKTLDQQGRSILYEVGRMGRRPPQNQEARERETVRILVRAGVDPNIAGLQGNVRLIPLLMAIEAGHFSAAQALVEAGASLSGTDHFGNTALALCLRGGGAEIPVDFMRFLLDKGADPNCRFTPNWLPAPQNKSMSLLVRTLDLTVPGVSQENRQKAAQLLLEHGAKFANPVDEKTERLLEAAGKGDLNALKKAISAGADVNGADGDGWNALMVSFALGHQACADWLESQKASSLSVTKDGYSLLYFAAAAENEELVRRLLDAGADPNPANPLHSPLSCAVNSGNRPIFDLLLKHGAKGTGRNILTCILHSEPEMARLMLDSGGEVEENPPNWEKRSNIYYAVYYGQPEILKMLLEHGADPLAKDKYGKTPLEALRLLEGAGKTIPILEAAVKQRQASLPKPAVSSSKE